MIEAFSEETL